MASFLEGPLAKAIATGFKGKLNKGMLRRSGPSTVDEYGDPQPGPDTAYTVEGFVDSYSAYVRAQAGVPDTDSKVCILGATLPRGIVPRQSDRITIAGRNFVAVRLTNVDPANALYEIQATEQVNG